MSCYHKNTVVATAIDPFGQRIAHAKFGPKDEELTAFLGKLPGEKHVALEAGSVWEHYYDAAASTGAAVTLSHPKKTRLIADATLKNDKVDSEALAELLRLNALPTSYAPEAETRTLRELVRERVFYLKKETAIRNHTYSYLNRKGIPFEEGILSRVRRREELRGLQIEVVDRALDMLAQLHEVTRDLDRKVENACAGSKEAQLLRTIPGVGAITALTLTAFITPVSRFPNIDHFCSYCGFAPKNWQSGNTGWVGHLVEDCNHLLRFVLIEASWGSRRVEKRGAVAKAGNRVARRRQDARIGATAAGHKLAKICYGVLRRGTPYTHDAPEHNSRDGMTANSPATPGSGAAL